MTRSGFCKKCFIVTLGFLGASQASAQVKGEIDKSQAAEIARQKFGGQLFGKIKVLNAGDGSTLYEVRLEDNGRIRIVYVDSSGNIRQQK